MLAYVFWHWKQSGVTADRYEHALRQFHAALALHPPAGFQRSWSVAISGAIWTPPGTDAYEDWYLLDDSGGLDLLNESAVTASRQLPHDTVAAMARGGSAGLWRMRDEGQPVASPTHAYWFGKPTGMSYSALGQLVTQTTSGLEVALWTRQMVLGPAPEFCLHTTGPIMLPESLTVVPVTVRQVWP
jgi:hypothetical protein